LIQLYIMSQFASYGYAHPLNERYPPGLSHAATGDDDMQNETLPPAGELAAILVCW